MKAEAGPILAAALTGILLGTVVWRIPEQHDSASAQFLASISSAGELRQELGRIQTRLQLLRHRNPGAAYAVRSDHAVDNVVVSDIDSMTNGRRKKPPPPPTADESQPHALPGIDTEATCKAANRRHPCKYHPEPVKHAVDAALQRAVGPNGTLLMVGDSTMRYQFGTFCNCLQVQMCSAVRVKGTVRRMQICGPTSAGGLATHPLGSTLAVYDEIAGGPHHVPWTHSANRANASLQRFGQAVPAGKRDGRIVVYLNFGALHTLWLKYPVPNKPAHPGWKLPGAGRGGGFDFIGFVQMRERLRREVADYRNAGAAAIVVMSPHTVCVKQMPHSLQVHMDEEAFPDNFNASLYECAQFLLDQPTFPELAQRPLPARVAYCAAAQMNKHGANTIRTVLREEIEAMKAEGAADIGFVDAFKITDDEGCEMTEDGRQYGFHIAPAAAPHSLRKIGRC